MAAHSMVNMLRMSVSSSPYLLPSILVAVVAVVALFRRGTTSNKDIPLFVPAKSPAGSVRKRWIWDSPALLQEGYKKFPNKPFRIWTTEGDQVVLPPDYVDQVKMLPDHTFPSALMSFFLHTYLWGNIKTSQLDAGYTLIRDINKAMPRVFPQMRDEVDIIFPLTFPDSKEWQSVNVYPKILRLVSRANAKIFVGNGLHENEEWIDITSNYTRYIFVSSAKLRFFPQWLRPLVQYTIPELRKVWNCISTGERLLAPLLAERERLDTQPDAKKPDDPLEWLRGHMGPADRNGRRLHSIMQLNFGALSVNTTSQTLTNCIFNLATYPEYLDVLREEVEEVLAENGGEWTLDSMSKLKKTDSFIKETLRHSGHLTATFQRQALRPIHLSDGTRISPGTYTFAPANAINFDPSIYPSPSTFDGMRFYKLRQASTDDDRKHQLTSITKTEMQFGSGRHACSGRWFASHEIKLVLAQLVTEYEVRLQDGGARPKSILYQTNQLPDPKAEVLFRKRS